MKAQRYLEEEFHNIFDKNYYVDIRGLPILVDGAREGNHVWFVYKFAGGDELKKATLSWFPHLGYVLDDLEIKTVMAKTKKVVEYE